MKILSKFAGFFRTKKYIIGFFNSEEYLPLKQTGTRDIKWLDLNGYSEGWFADPFILSINGSCIHVLVEEFLYSKHKGRISCLTINRSNDEYILKEVKPILELDTHLSFPNVFREEGRVYICPENFQSGKVILYEFDEKKLEVKTSYVLLNEPLVDVQIVKNNGFYYALGTPTVTGEMDETKHLNVYKSNLLTGEYKLFCSIDNNKKEERGAGAIYMTDFQLIRPIQCCEGRYGKEVIFRSLSITDKNVLQAEILRLKPKTYKKWGLALHTYNWYEGLSVVDGQDYVRVIPISRVIDPLIRQLSSLKH